MQADRISVHHDHHFGLNGFQILVQLHFVGLLLQDGILFQFQFFLPVNKAFYVGNVDRIEIGACDFINELLLHDDSAALELSQQVAGEFNASAIAGVVEFIIVVVGLIRLVDPFHTGIDLLLRFIRDLSHHQVVDTFRRDVEPLIPVEFREVDIVILPCIFVQDMQFDHVGLCHVIVSPFGFLQYRFHNAIPLFHLPGRTQPAPDAVFDSCRFVSLLFREAAAPKSEQL